MNELQNFKKFLLDDSKSKNTIEAYIRDVKQFLTYIKNKPLKNITNNDIDTYKKYMLNIKKISPISVNRKLVAIHQFLDYNQIAINIKQVKIHKQNFLDDIFNQNDIKKLIQITEVHKDLRAKALILTMQLTGMRISEVLQLTVDDINKDRVTIIGKGNKRRVVFIPKKLNEIWNEYGQVRIKKTNKLFTGKKGAINRITAHTIIKKYAKLSDVDLTKAHCHNFRHYYCKSLVDKDLPIDVIADLVGHSDINTTRIYTRKTQQELLNIINDLD